MKKSIKSILAIAFLAFLTFSFTTVKKSKKVIIPEKSNIVWKGHKVTGDHEGFISVKSGFLTFNNDKLSGGEITVDMSTISNTDLEGDYKKKLEGHLKSADF